MNANAARRIWRAKASPLSLDKHAKHHLDYESMLFKPASQPSLMCGLAAFLTARMACINLFK